jgi:hypothetical protein
MSRRDLSEWYKNILSHIAFMKLSLTKLENEVYVSQVELEQFTFACSTTSLE